LGNQKLMLLHRYFIQNGEVTEISAFHTHAGIEIYEVVRVMKKVPLFLEDHLKRFFHSAWLCHLEIPLDEESIASMLNKLITINGVEEGNIRFSWCFTQAGIFQAYFIPHFYPDESLVSQGVSCGILHAERSDPNAKVVHSNLRETANQMISERGLYEVLLVNQQREFTEGSRSNLFFLTDGVFVTAHSSDILPGITRQKVIDLLVASGKKVMEQNMRTNELPSVDAAFLTGTSPKVLPIKAIEEFSFKTDHAEICKLMADYDRLIQQYLRNRLHD
jgi:branched-chain amino acid aminotransferase